MKRKWFCYWNNMKRNWYSFEMKNRDKRYIYYYSDRTVKEVWVPYKIKPKLLWKVTPIQGAIVGRKCQ